MERWKINLYTVWAAQILSMMSFGFGLPFLPYYIQELGVVDQDKVKLYSGILSAVPAISMGIMAPIWGMLADRYGKKLMLLRAMFFASFIIGAMGLVTRVEHLIFLRFAQGMFTGTATASSALIASGTPDHKLSSSLGFLSSSTFIGVSVGPLIGGFLAENIGYRISFFAGGLLMVINFLLVYFFVKEDTDTLKAQNESTKPKLPILSIFSATTITMLLILIFMRISRTVFNPYLPLFVQQIKGTIEGAPTLTGIITGITGVMTALSALKPK